MANRVQQSIEVNAPVHVCYDRWCHFEEFPCFMENVESITRQAGDRIHWEVKGPLGKSVGWDAVIDGMEQDKLISWHSVAAPHEDQDVGVQGAVRFDEVNANACNITVTIQYEPPAGALGELVAAVFSNPDNMLKEDLANFKRMVETGGACVTSHYNTHGVVSGIDTPTGNVRDEDLSPRLQERHEDKNYKDLGPTML